MSQKGPNKPENSEEERDNVAKNKGVAGFAATLIAAVNKHEETLKVTEEVDDIHPGDLSEEEMDELNQGDMGTELLFRTTSAPAPSNDILLEATKPPVLAGLSEENYIVYRNKFSDSPYSALAQMIKERNSEVAGATVHGQTHYFIKRLQNITPALEFAVNGAMQAVKEAEKSGDTEMLQAATLTLNNFKKVQEMYLSLEALANNKSRYSQSYYENKLKKIFATIPLDDQIDLHDAIEESVGNELSSNRPFYQLNTSGSTEFDATIDKLDLEKFTKRVKIQHEFVEENGVKNLILKAGFSYNRNNLMNSSGIKKYWGDPVKERQKLITQVSDFVTVAIHEYNKGSQARPIDIKYFGPKEANLSDMAIAILTEYKKRAISEGKPLYAKSPTGKIIEITSSSSFSEDEKNYFLHFATQTPSVKAGSESKQSAGAIFYDASSNEPAVIEKAMKSHFVDWHKEYGEKMSHKMDKVANQFIEKSAMRPGTKP